MLSIRCIVCMALVFINVYEIKAHGRLMDPVHRGSAFRAGFPTPINWDDDGNYCGGYGVHYLQNEGKCGVCGDNYAERQPRANENGGKYGTGTIVKTYKAGNILIARVDVTANHFGFFKFTLCPLRSDDDLETEECFDAHKLELMTGGHKYPVTTRRSGIYVIHLRLPQKLTCQHCVLRWEYVAGNNWAICDDNIERNGCGNQETFRTCSDIKIE